MPSRLRIPVARRVLALALGATLCATMIASGATSIFAQRRAAASASTAVQIVPGGVARVATRAGVVDLSKLPVAAVSAVKPAPRASLADHPLRTPAQLAAYQQWTLTHLNALPKANAMPAPRAGNTYGAGATPVLTSAHAGLTSVDGGGWYPPDQAIAAAPGYIFEGVNNVMEVYDWSYTKKFGPWTPDTFFASVKRSGDTFSDPQITFDAERSVYLISWLEINPTTGKDYLDLAISKTSSPSPLGNFFVYQVDPTAISGWSDVAIDYPTLGYDYWGLYITFMGISISTGAPLSNRTFAFSLNNMLSGSLGLWNYWYAIKIENGNSAFQLSPTIEDGVPQAEWITASDAIWGMTSNNLTVCAITNTHALGTSVSPTYTCKYTALPLTYDDPASGAAQPGTSATLETGQGYKQVAYRNGQLYFAMPIAINCSGNLHTGIFWAAVTPQLTTIAAANPQQSNGIVSSYSQAGYLCYSDADAFMPTLIAGSEGDMALVYNLSSANRYPTIVYTGRTPADAPGTMGQGYSYFVLDGMNSNDSGRWGDYSACALTTNLVTRGIVYCGGEFGGPNTKLGGYGWDTELYSLRME